MALANWIIFLARQQQATQPDPAPGAQEEATDAEASGEPDTGEAGGSGEEDDSDFVESHLDWESLQAGAAETWNSFRENFVSWESLWQVLVIFGAAGLGWLCSRYPASRLRKFADSREQHDILKRLALSLASIVWPAFTVLFLWIATAAFDALGLPNAGLRVAASLMNGWIVVRFVTSTMKPGFWQTAVAILAWTVAALYILRLLGPVTDALNAAAFTVAGVRITLMRIITSFIIAVVALWIGRIAGDAAQSQLQSNKKLNPSMAGLLGQVLKVGFMTAAILIALSTLGVNLTALAVFGGALGVGIGFGLQSIFSNFISGIIILFERSIKVGDFIGCNRA